MERLKCFMKRPDSGWYATNISCSLGNLQNIVGGYIEVVTLPELGVVIVCNEEGRLLDIPYNTTICDINFVGTIVVLGFEGDEFVPVAIPLKEWKQIMEVNEHAAR